MKLGEPRGKACLYPRDIGVAMMAPDVMKLEADEQGAHAAYLMFFYSPVCKDIV